MTTIKITCADDNPEVTIQKRVVMELAPPPPTDEEIQKWAKKQKPDTLGEFYAAQEGAKWMRSKMEGRG